jgi:rhodanese-related sulfurtransferase
MSARALSARSVRTELLMRREVALLDLRDEARFAEGHPLFAAQLPLSRIDVEIGARVPRKDTLIVLYDEGEGLVGRALERFGELGYSNVAVLDQGLEGWRNAGFELFRDVNSYCKAFGELVATRKQTPSLTADEVHARITSRANIAIVDARRFSEYQTMSIPTAISVPGADLVLFAGAYAPDPETTIIVNCAGRTRSIIGAQSLINAGVPNKTVSLRNGTIGWSLAGKALATKQTRSISEIGARSAHEAQRRAREVAYRAGVKHIDAKDLASLAADSARTLYRFDVRSPEEYARGHIDGFHNAPGGQLVQEADVFAPVRGARLVVADDLAARADMTASWLAQMAWEVYVLDTDHDLPRAKGETDVVPPRNLAGRYKRPYEGTDNPTAAMQAYLDWEFTLEAQLAKDDTHGFFVI